MQISTLPLLNIEEEATLNDDEECASRQIVRHVAVALKKYMEAHLYWKAEQLQRAENARTERDTWQPSLPPYKVIFFVLFMKSILNLVKIALIILYNTYNNTYNTYVFQACKLSADEVQTKVEVLQELMSLRALWPPVEQLHRLGGISLLLQIIAFAREWNYNTR